MARINLLPWRAELRKQRQREFITVIIGSAFLMVLVIAFFHIQISGSIDTQNSRNRYLESEIKLVEAQIKEIQDLEMQKQQLVARMKVIEQLQRDRPAIVHLFDELAKSTPDGLYLTSVTQKNSVLNIEGVAESNARVSALMRNLEASPWLDNPVLEIIQIETSDNSRKFKLRVTQTSGQDGK
ncbi:MAG: PilN domain-containing protein [Thiohalomonadaceae bacterium]